MTYGRERIPMTKKEKEILLKIIDVIREYDTKLVDGIMMAEAFVTSAHQAMTECESNFFKADGISVKKYVPTQRELQLVEQVGTLLASEHATPSELLFIVQQILGFIRDTSKEIEAEEISKEHQFNSDLLKTVREN